MSNQSMKYHSVAPIEMLEAYSRGELSVSDSKWIEQLIQKNPMVQAVAENISSINIATVKSISNSTSKGISSLYLGKIGFWSKFGVWIGLSSIVLVIGLALFFQNNNSAVYEQTSLSQKLISPKKVPSNSHLAALTPMTNDEVEEDEILAQPTEEKEHIQEAPEIEDNTTAPITTKQLVVKNKKLGLKQKEKADVIEIVPIDNGSKSDNTRTFSSNTKTIENQSVVLSVQDVQILAKSNPKDVKRTSNGNKGNPMKAFGSKSESNSSYAMDDVPSFTGGDRALQDYFIGKLRPLKIKKGEDHYDRNVMIDLEINSRGKLKNYNVHGNLHPTHQKALIQAIKDLPRFSSGSENVVYSIGISF